MARRGPGCLKTGLGGGGCDTKNAQQSSNGSSNGRAGARIKRAAWRLYEIKRVPPKCTKGAKTCECDVHGCGFVTCGGWAGKEWAARMGGWNFQRASISSIYFQQLSTTMSGTRSAGQTARLQVCKVAREAERQADCAVAALARAPQCSEWAAAGCR